MLRDRALALSSRRARRRICCWSRFAAPPTATARSGPHLLLRVVTAAVTARRVADRASEPDSLVGLTPRERETAILVGERLSNAEISGRLRMGITTVKTHVASAMAKTGSDNRVQLAVTVVRARLR